MKMILLFFLPFSLFANDCDQQISSFGDGKGNDYIEKSCIKEVKENSVISNHPELFGSGGLLIFRDKIFAGEYTTLSAIKSLSYQKRREEIAVLDGDRILIFSAKLSGNVAPLRILESSHIFNAYKVELTEKLIKIYQEEEILSFSANANSLQRKGKKEDKLLGRVSNGVSAKDVFYLK